MAIALTNTYQEIIISGLVAVEDKYGRYSVWSKINSQSEENNTSNILFDFRYYCSSGTYFWNDNACQAVVQVNYGKTDQQDLSSGNFVLGTVTITPVSKVVLSCTVTHNSGGDKTITADSAGLLYPSSWGFGHADLVLPTIEVSTIRVYMGGEYKKGNPYIFKNGAYTKGKLYRYNGTDWVKGK